MSSIRKQTLRLVLPFIMVGFSISSVTFAWFVWTKVVKESEFRPGELESGLSVQRWISGSWTSGNGALLLGTMDNIAELPSDSDSYLKIHATEGSDAGYKYDVQVENIVLSITNMTDTYTFPELEYYSSMPSQKVFDYYYVIGADNLNPITDVFNDVGSLNRIHITTMEQSLNEGVFLEDDEYLYIFLKPRLLEIQNMVDIIPIDYTPYAINFNLHYRVEIRTAD